MHGILLALAMSPGQLLLAGHNIMRQWRHLKPVATVYGAPCRGRIQSKLHSGDREGAYMPLRLSQAVSLDSRNTTERRLSVIPGVL